MGLRVIDDYLLTIEDKYLQVQLDKFKPSQTIYANPIGILAIDSHLFIPRPCWMALFGTSEVTPQIRIRGPLFYNFQQRPVGGDYHIQECEDGKKAVVDTYNQLIPTIKQTKYYRQTDQIPTADWWLNEAKIRGVYDLRVSLQQLSKRKAN